MRLHEQLGGPEPDDELERELMRLRRERDVGERSGEDDGFEGAEYRSARGGGGAAVYALAAIALLVAAAAWWWARAGGPPW